MKIKCKELWFLKKLITMKIFNNKIIIKLMTINKYKIKMNKYKNTRLFGQDMKNKVSLKIYYYKAVVATWLQIYVQTLTQHYH